MVADTHVPLEGWICSPIPKFTGGLDIVFETWDSVIFPTKYRHLKKKKKLHYLNFLFTCVSKDIEEIALKSPPPPCLFLLI